MSAIFHITWEDAINVERRWHLPPALCPNCGKFGQVRIFFPDISLDPFRDELPLTKLRWRNSASMPWEEFIHLREKVQRLTGVTGILPPCTDFGPLIGRAFYKAHDFEGDAYFYPCIAEDAAEKLRASGIRLQTHPTLITPHKRTQQKYLEIFAPPVADIGSVAKATYCGDCGCWKVGVKAIPRVIRASTVPKGLDFFRIKQWAGYVLCTEQVKATVERLNLTGAVFVPVTVIDE